MLAVRTKVALLGGSYRVYKEGADGSCGKAPTPIRGPPGVSSGRAPETASPSLAGFGEDERLHVKGHIEATRVRPAYLVQVELLNGDQPREVLEGVQQGQ